jgi:hypothetical protein
MSSTYVHDGFGHNGARPSLGLRMDVLAHRWSLDQRLAEGAYPERDAALGLRARQLTSPKLRRRLADSLTRAVRRVSVPNVFSPAAPLDRRAVAQVRPQLVELADRLQDSTRPVEPRGVAMIKELLADGTSPLYSPRWDQDRSENELSQRLSAAARALSHD